MTTQPKFKLRLTSLKFISAVDLPAQETATIALVKRAGAADEISATMRIAKLNEELGIAFGFALTSTVDGAPYFDLQGDAIGEDELVKVAAEYLEAGGAIDEQHDSVPDAGRLVFAYPLTTEIASSLGIETKKTGLLVGVKLAPDVLAKVKSGAITGFSIAGFGERTPLEKAKRARLTAGANGHSHVIDDDSIESGETSEEDDFEGTGRKHRHSWTRLSSGAIQLGEALGHTHEVLDHALDQKTACEKRDDENRHGGFMKWLAGLEPDTALGIAKTNANQSWGRAWIEKVAGVAKAAQGPRVDEQFFKSAEVSFAKAAEALDAYLATHVVKRQKERPLERHDATNVAGDLMLAGDKEMLRLYEQWQKSKERLLYGPRDEIAGPFDAQIRHTMTSIDARIEAYALQHNIPLSDARGALERLSSAHRADTERLERLTNEKYRALAAAEAQSHRVRSASLNAGKLASAPAKAETPAERALNEHVAMLAKARGISTASALDWAIVHDERTVELYKAWVAESDKARAR